MVKYLLDTNILSEASKKIPDKSVLEKLRRHEQGLTPSFADAQIAAVASVNSLILVTRNVSDFEHFSGLIIENWHNT